MARCIQQRNPSCEHASAATRLLVTVAALLTLAGCQLPGPSEKETIALSWDQQRAALKYQLASEELHRGRTDQALALSQEALTLDPENPSHAELVAQTYIAKGDFRTAQNLLTAVVSKHREVPGCWYLLGTIAERASDWGQAADAFEQAATLDPARLAYLVAWAQTLRNQHGIEAALALMTRRESDYSDVPGFHVTRAELQRDAGRLPAACASYDKALRLGLDDPEVRGALGLCQYWLGHFKAARVNLGDVVRTEKANESVKTAYAGALLALESYRDAVRWLDRFVVDYPDSARLWLLLAQARDASGDARRALAAAQRAAHNDGQLFEAQLIVANLYLRNGRLEDAHAAIQRALQINRDDLDAWRLYKRILRELGDTPLTDQSRRARR